MAPIYNYDGDITKIEKHETFKYSWNNVNKSTNLMPTRYLTGWGGNVAETTHFIHALMNALLKINENRNGVKFQVRSENKVDNPRYLNNPVTKNKNEFEGGKNVPGSGRML